MHFFSKKEILKRFRALRDSNRLTEDDAGDGLFTACDYTTKVSNYTPGIYGALPIP
jgi:hypothetical protein